MTVDSAIQVDRDSDVAIVTLNVPAKRNALNRQARGALRDTLCQLMNAEPDVRAIVLTGAGGHFSAGADVSQMAAPSTLQTRQSIDEMGEITAQLTGGTKPVIAAVEGIAYGIGLSFAAACDFVVVSKNARFCAAFIRIGLLPDAGLMWSLPRRVGMPKAREMLSLATEISGEEAGVIGLASHVVEPGQALTEAVEIAKRFSAMPMLGLAYLKNGLTYRAGSFEDSLRSEMDHQVVLRHTADHQEAALAFVEKRRPVFVGR
jgi:enoyl-CoA hydratase/carnithine racemase